MTGCEGGQLSQVNQPVPFPLVSIVKFFLKVTKISGIGIRRELGSIVLLYYKCPARKRD